MLDTDGRRAMAPFASPEEIAVFGEAFSGLEDRLDGATFESPTGGAVVVVHAFEQSHCQRFALREVVRQWRRGNDWCTYHTHRPGPGEGRSAGKGQRIPALLYLMAADRDALRREAQAAQQVLFALGLRKQGPSDPEQWQEFEKETAGEVAERAAHYGVQFGASMPGMAGGVSERRAVQRSRVRERSREVTEDTGAMAMWLRIQGVARMCGLDADQPDAALKAYHRVVKVADPEMTFSEESRPKKAARAIEASSRNANLMRRNITAWLGGFIGECRLAERGEVPMGLLFAGDDGKARERVAQVGAQTWGELREDVEATLAALEANGPSGGAAATLQALSETLSEPPMDTLGMGPALEIISHAVLLEGVLRGPEVAAGALLGVRPQASSPGDVREGADMVPAAEASGDGAKRPAWMTLVSRGMRTLFGDSRGRDARPETARLREKAQKPGDSDLNEGDPEI